MSIHLVSFVGHLAFFLTAISFVVKDIVALRILAIFSSVAAIFYNYFHPMGSPDWIPLSWCIIFALINVWRVCQIYTEKYQVSLSSIELEMLDTSFSNFNPVEFAKLMRASHWESVDASTTLTKENEVPEKLYFVQNGSILVTRDAKEIARISDGTFIGEMSFINDSRASATTTTLTSTKLVAWDRLALDQLLSRNPTLSILLKHSISVDLTKKIKGQPDPI
ncbi:MAG: cyclic nucleotide-binding domain-containing protein [Burkholderiales bacterium]|nr:cyclic nucleotide-binding domain-containing protein [Burkholderiales bacterium]|tara:strand:+ start:119 stop:784 length:666 start_codon:yes stop_codon:yes gene_type:complete